jgi:DNA gyrase subunit A
VARIKELEALLASEKKMRAVIAEELTKVKEQYGDRRRTQIVQARRGKRGAPLLTATDLAPDKDTWVVVTADGLISRTATARSPRLAGRSAPILVLGARGRDTLYLFDAAGNGAALAVHTLPEVDDPKDGNPVAGSTPFPPEARVVAGVALSPDRGPGQGCLFFCTRAGMVKRVMLDALPGPSARSFTAMNVSAGDSLGWVRVTSGGDEVLLVSGAGLAILFAEVEVRPTGLAAGGVLGIRLADERTIVVAMDTARPQSDLLLVTENGQAKRTPVSQFPTQGRHGKGVRAWKASGEARLAGAAVGLGEDRAVAHLARAAAHSLRFADFPRRSRAAAGKLAFEVKAGDRVTDVAGIVARPTFKPLEVETVAEASAPKRKAARRETPPKGRRRAARREPAKSKVARTPKKASGPGDGAAKKKRRPKSKAGGGKR